MNSTIYADLAAEVEINDGATISKTLFQDDYLKVILFGFAAGQELSEHTASVPAIIQFLDGDAVVTVGEQRLEASTHTFIQMDANLPHSISAKSPTRMLLFMIKGAK